MGLVADFDEKDDAFPLTTLSTRMRRGKENITYPASEPLVQASRQLQNAPIIKWIYINQNAIIFKYLAIYFIRASIYFMPYNPTPATLWWGPLSWL
jgi:hypothetical protein